MKKNILIIFLALFLLSACHGSSLISPSGNDGPPLGKLFAQVQMKSAGDHHHFESGDYEVHLDEINWVIGNVRFLTSSQNRQAHTGEHPEDPPASEHEEPTSCNFEESMNQFVFFSLTKDSLLPCVLLAEGSYEGVSFELNGATAQNRFGEFPEGVNYSLKIRGKAVKNGVDHPFEIKTRSLIPITLSKSVNLNAENHHLAVRVDVAEWFHGVDFATLDKGENDQIFLDESHNTEKFEHLIEHFQESFQL